MTVRTAELLMAIALALASIAIMLKSAELNIGWVRGLGPGAGAWPFWLSLGMLITCIWTIVKWFLRLTPESRSTEPYMTANGFRIIGPTVLALIALLIGSHVIGMYFSVLFFMVYYIRIVGRHSWITTIGISVGAPILLFIFFDWALKSPLPKGISEPLFYPIYDLIY